jgi:hypothetical protein
LWGVTKKSNPSWGRILYPQNSETRISEPPVNRALGQTKLISIDRIPCLGTHIVPAFSLRDSTINNISRDSSFLRFLITSCGNTIHNTT